MNRAIIVHCWDGYPEYCWYPGTKKELETAGFVVQVPVMPEAHAPKLPLWLAKLQEAIGAPDEHLYLIGHSSGCITILRYLEALKADENIGGVVLVAGFTNDLGYKELSNFFETPINFGVIRSRAKQFAVICSTDDPFVPLAEGVKLKQELNAKLIVKKGMGHFSASDEHPYRCTELAEAGKEVIRMAAR